MNSAKVYDYNVYALEARARKALSQNNLVEAHAIGLLIDGYVEGLWTIFWERGEPLFAAVTHSDKVLKAECAEKD